MTPSALATVLIRVLALIVFAFGLWQIVAYWSNYFLWGSESFQADFLWWTFWIVSHSGLFQLILGAVAWMLSRKLGKLVGSGLE